MYWMYEIISTLFVEIVKLPINKKYFYLSKEKEEKKKKLTESKEKIKK